MISTEDMVDMLRERDEQHFRIVQEKIEALEAAMKTMLLAQAEWEAHDWNKLDELSFASDEDHLRMKAIRNDR